MMNPKKVSSWNLFWNSPLDSLMVSIRILLRILPVNTILPRGQGALALNRDVVGIWNRKLAPLSSLAGISRSGNG